MEFSKVSGVYRLENHQFLPVSLSEAWNFFSNPTNLQSMTPKELDFKIKSLDAEKTYSGQIITYSIKLNKLFKMSWVTEITHLQKEKYFVDEQRFGPYKFWHHVHKFEEVEGGIFMTDIVHFKLPLSRISGLAYRLFVKKKLKEIFKYREDQLNKIVWH